MDVCEFTIKSPIYSKITNEIYGPNLEFSNVLWNILLDGETKGGGEIRKSTFTSMRAPKIQREIPQAALLYV